MGSHVRGWVVVLAGERVLLLPMGFGFAKRGRAEIVDLVEGNSSVLLLGWPCKGGGVSGAINKWRRSFASLSVKYRVWPGGRVPRFSGPN